MPNKLFVFLGNSGAGKTTAQNYLETRGVRSYHMIEPLYKAWAEFLGLPLSYVMRNKREIYIPGSSMTLQDYLEASYHWHLGLGLKPGAIGLPNILPKLLDQGSVSLGSLRHLEEAEALKKSLAEGFIDPKTPCILVLLGGRGAAGSTDQQVPEITHNLVTHWLRGIRKGKPWVTHSIYNSPRYPQNLKRQLDYLLDL